MTGREKEQLLTEILDGEEGASLREATLSAGLKALRWRRRRRLAAYASLLALPVVLLALMQIGRQDKTVVLAQAQLPPPKPKVERITTEELFALFPGRQLALVGAPGNQQLVFLDQGQR